MRSFIKQNLLIEFSSLKHASPRGVFVTITPNNPALWLGVLFAYQGPFSPSVLRFQICFPDDYPNHAPLITFSTDVFHPLVTPLSTYTYTPTVTESETISASNQERLPPGGFSLCHAFPQWFVPESQNRSISVYELLDYLRYAFNDEQCLNSLTVQDAANTGAFHAWQSYQNRRKQKRANTKLAIASIPSTASAATGGAATTATVSSSSPSSSPQTSRARKPGEWNWEGVWEERVKRGIHASLSEQSLYGNPDELIRFVDFDHEMLEKITQELPNFQS